jgi:hypothetical protein
MTNQEKIIRYLDGTLDSTDIEAVKAEIEKSTALRKEYERLLSLKKRLKKLSEVEADPDYFINLLPRFRERINQKKKKSFLPAYALGTVLTALIIFAAVVFLNDSDSTLNLIEISAQLEDNELESILVYYSNGNTYSIDDEEDGSELFLSELFNGDNNSIDMEALKTLSLKYAIDDVLEDVSDQEADLIVNEISNKNILMSN